MITWHIDHSDGDFQHGNRNEMKSFGVWEPQVRVEDKRKEMTRWTLSCLENM